MPYPVTTLFPKSFSIPLTGLPAKPSPKTMFLAVFPIELPLEPGGLYMLCSGTLTCCLYYPLSKLNPLLARVSMFLDLSRLLTFASLSFYAKYSPSLVLSYSRLRMLKAAPPLFALPTWYFDLMAFTRCSCLSYSSSMNSQRFRSLSYF